MITFIAPFPKSGEVREGWMSRIAAVDRLFANERRTYIQVVDDDTAGMPKPFHASDLVDVYYLNLSLVTHYDKLRSLVLDSQMVYVHTIHMARFVLPFYKTGKIVTDIHGVTPEEELLYGKRGSALFYEEIERTVISVSRYAIVVTNAMAGHYRSKYPASTCEFIVLPIFETIYPRADRRLEQTAHRKHPMVLYSGGPQKWQNVDLMLDLARERIETCDFTFLSNKPEEFMLAAQSHGIEGRVSIQSVKKLDLADYYLDADFGLVLRDDIAVNRVACPTKLSEYLWFGVIPVVLSPDLGDFKMLGYCYVTYDDFKDGRLPSHREQREMRSKNFEVISTIKDCFESSAEKVKGLRSQMPRVEFTTLAFLTDMERNVIFPALSELHLTFQGDFEMKVLNEYFAEPFRSVNFDLKEAFLIKRLTWVPINRECRLRLNAIRIENNQGDMVPYTMSGNYDEFSNGIARFSAARYPQIHFDFDPNMTVKQFTAEFDFLSLGFEVSHTATHLPQTTRYQQDNGLIQLLKSKAKTYPWILRAYFQLQQLKTAVISYISSAWAKKRS